MILDLSCYRVIFICLQVFHLWAQFYHIGFLALHLVAKQCRGYRVSFARMPWDQSYTSQVHLKEATQHRHLGRLVSGRQTRNLTIFNVICWNAGLMRWSSHRPNVWWYKYYFFFHNLLQNSLQKSIQFFFFECLKFKPAIHCFIFNLSK